MLHTVCELIINVTAYGTNTNESGLLSVSRIRPTSCGFSEDAPLDPEWGVVCARPQRCTVSDEHSNRELQPQHSLAIVRIHHPGQRLNSAGLHVQTCKPVYEQPPATLSASVSDTGPNECNTAFCSASVPSCLVTAADNEHLLRSAFHPDWKHLLNFTGFNCTLMQICNQLIQRIYAGRHGHGDREGHTECHNVQWLWTWRLVGSRPADLNVPETDDLLGLSHINISRVYREQETNSN